MKQGALVNPLAYDDPATKGLKVTRAELLGTIAERDSAPVPLEPFQPRPLGDPLPPPTLLGPLFDRYPSATTAAVVLALVLLLGVAGIGAPADEAAAHEAAEALAASEPQP